MTLPRFTIRLRPVESGDAILYPVHPRTGEIGTAAVRRAVRAASGDPHAVLVERTDTPILSADWRYRYRLTYLVGLAEERHAEVDVPAWFCAAWL